MELDILPTYLRGYMHVNVILESNRQSFGFHLPIYPSLPHMFEAGREGRRYNVMLHAESGGIDSFIHSFIE